MIYKITLSIITTLLTLSVVIPFIGISEVISEPFDQMRLYFLIGSLLLLALCLFSKFWLTAGIYVVLILAHVSVITKAYPIIEKKKACNNVGPPLTIMAYNIYYKNQDTSKIIATILAGDADILALQEGKEKFLDESYEALSEKYPFSYPNRSKGEFFSPAIFSKYPIKEIKKEKMPVSAVRILQATIEFEGQDIQFASIHAISPKNARTIKKRNLFIQDLANYSQSLRYEDQKFIFAGDFNSVPWHPKLIALQKQGGLTGNTSVWNYFGTWPNWGAPIFSVPIDHIFSSQGLKKISFKKVNHSAGSDHFPVKSAILVCK